MSYKLWHLVFDYGPYNMALTCMDNSMQYQIKPEKIFEAFWNGSNRTILR